MTPTITDITRFLETIAPPALQESYDNAGLLVGDASQECTGALVCLDCTEEVVKEAIAQKCNLIVAHHPIVFGGLKRFTGRNYVERTVMLAIKNDIAIYAAHTNLDNVFRKGVNGKICEKLGIEKYRILQPKKNTLRQLVTYAPVADASKVRDALFAAGAGSIGEYSECSFNTVGMGTFKGSEASNPTVGERGERHHEAETKIEVVFAAHIESAVIKAMRSAHPYEEVAYGIFEMSNAHPEIGAGMIGTLSRPVPLDDFLDHLKATMNVGCIKHTWPIKETVQKIAVCGGAGGFLLRDAIAQGADMFITADYKYHEFFDADGKIVIADIGHYESEQFTQELFCELISEKFPTFAVRLTTINTNPVLYR